MNSSKVSKVRAKVSDARVTKVSTKPSTTSKVAYSIQEKYLLCKIISQTANEELLMCKKIQAYQMCQRNRAKQCQ